MAILSDINSGIYKITNILDGKVYIGSAVNFTKRKREHYSTLIKGNHHNKYLQRSYSKIKKDHPNKKIIKYFKWEILEYATEENLLKEEQKYLDNFKIKDKNKINNKICYNMSPIAGNQLGYKHTEETKKKISNLQLGKKLSQEHKGNISKGNMGRIFSEEAKEKIRKSNKGKKRSEEFKNKMIENNGMSRKVINLDTGKIFSSISKASRYYNVCSTTIHVVCSGKGRSKTAGGYKWSYADEKSIKESKLRYKKDNRKKIINITTGEVFNSIIEVEKKYHISHSNISNVCKGIRKTAGGYEWQYINEVSKITNKEVCH